MMHEIIGAAATVGACAALVSLPVTLTAVCINIFHKIGEYNYGKQQTKKGSYYRAG